MYICIYIYISILHVYVVYTKDMYILIISMNMVLRIYLRKIPNNYEIKRYWLTN